MKRKLNKKAFTLVEIVIAVAILAAASIGIGTIVVGVQNNSQNQFTQGDLQQQLAEVQDSLKNDLLTTNAGVKYWIKDDSNQYIKSDGANKNPDRDKIVALYAMDYIDNTLTKTYVKYDATEDLLYKATITENVIFDNSKKMLLDESPEEIVDNTELDWQLYAQGIANFSMDLSKYEENQTVNYNVNIGNDRTNYESDNTVNVRNEIPINEASVLENFDQAVVTRPALKNISFVYNGQEQGPKQLDVNSRYMEIRVADANKDRTTATAVGKYRITYHLKNATWDDGSHDDYTLEWEIVPRTLTVDWGVTEWVYDGLEHYADVSIGNLVPGEAASEQVIDGSIGPGYGTQTATLVIGNPNYTVNEADRTAQLSITKGIATYTVVPEPAGSTERPLVYNGQPQALLKPGSTSCGVIMYGLSANGQFSEQVPTATDSNNETPYIVYYYIKGQGSYADSPKKYISVIMKRADPVITAPVGYDGENRVLRYDGSALPLLYSSGSTTAGTLEYSLDGDMYSESIPTGINASRYTIWYRSKGNSNYNQSTPEYVESRILKTERPSSSFVLPTVNDLTYTGDMQPLFREGSGSATQASGWLFKLGESGEWSSNVPQKDAAGDYDVYLRVPETADYAEYTLPSPITVTIKKAEPHFVADGAPQALPNLTYTGQPMNLIANGITRDGMIYYGISKTTTPPNTNEMSLQTPQGTGAGLYYVYYYIKGDDNHLDSAPVAIGATINKATPVVTTAPVPIESPYNGNDQILISLQGQSDTGLPVYYSLDQIEWSETPPVKMAAANYTIYYKVPSNENYKDSEIGTIISKITQAETRIVAPVPLEGLVYNGSTQQLCAVGDTQFGTMEYSVNNKNNWTANPPTAVNAGAYTIYWRVQETSDYKGQEGSIAVFVSKQALDIIPPQPAQLEYTGEAQYLINPNSAGTAPEGYHIEYRFEAPNAVWSTSLPMGTDAQTYDLEYRIVADDDTIGDNIDSSGMRMSVTIAPGRPIVTLEANTNLVYNGNPQYLLNPQTASSSLGTLEYCLTPDGEYSDTIVQAVDAGNYVVYWRTAYSSNLAQQTGSIAVTINRIKIPNPTIDNIQLQYTGEAQFPEINMDEDYVVIVAGGEPQTMPTDQGYIITFDLRDGINTEWEASGALTYELTWYIVKGTTMPIEVPAADPKTFTGYEQELLTPGVLDDSNGTIYYRLAGYKEFGANDWTEYDENTQPWTQTLPKATEIGEYRYLYRVDSFTYENIPETEIISSIGKGIMNVTIDETEVAYNTKYQRPHVYIDVLGNPNDLLPLIPEGEDAADYDLTLLQRDRITVEFSTDDGATWKQYVYPDDTGSYDAATHYIGEKNVGQYSILYRISDTQDEYEPQSGSILFAITPGRATFRQIPHAAELVYNGQSQALLTLEDDPERSGMHFEYQIASAVEGADGNPEIAGEWSARTTEIPTKINAGQYLVKVWAVAEDQYLLTYNPNQGEDHDHPEESTEGDETTGEGTEGEGTEATTEQVQEYLALDLVIPVNKATPQVGSMPYVDNDTLSFTNSNQSLGLHGGTFAADAGQSYFRYLVLYYETADGDPSVYTNGVGSTDQNKNESGTAVYWLNSDLSKLKPKDAGLYEIVWEVKGDNNHEDYLYTVDEMPANSIMVAIVDQSAASTNMLNDDLETTSTFSKTAWRNVVENTQATAIVFTTNVNTTGMQNAYDLSVEKNRSILAWESNNTLYVASSTTGSKVYAPVDSSGLFAGLNTMTSIDVTGLDTSIATNMSQMFMSFGKDATGKDVKILGLSTMSVRKTTNASQMFAEVGMNATTVYAPKLQSLEFKSTANVTDLTKNLGANATQIEIQ